MEDIQTVDEVCVKFQTLALDDNIDALSTFYNNVIINYEKDNKFNHMLELLEKLQVIFEKNIHMYKRNTLKLAKITQLMGEYKESLEYWELLKTLSLEDDAYVPLLGIIDIYKNSFQSMTEQDIQKLRAAYMSLLELENTPEEFDYEGWCQESIKFLSKHGPLDVLIKECHKELVRMPDDCQTIELLCRIHINAYPDSFIKNATPEFNGFIDKLRTISNETEYHSIVISILQACDLFYNSKDYPSALTILMEGYLEGNQAYPEINFYLASLYIKVRDLSSAERLIEEGLTMKNDSFCFQNLFWDHFALLQCESLALKALDYDNKGLKKGIAILEELKSKGTLDPIIVSERLALAYLKLGLNDQALQTYEDFHNALGESGMHLFQELKGIILFESGENVEMAITCLKSALEHENLLCQSPTLFKARQYLAKMTLEGHMDSDVGDQEEMLFDWLFTAAEIDAYSPLTFELMALAYLKNENHLHINEAVQCFERACDLYEYQNFGVAQQLADLYVEQGDYTSYHHILLKLFFVLTNQPRDQKISWVHQRLGIYYLQTGQYDDAITSFTQVFHYQQDDLISWKCLAHAYFCNKSYRAALRAFQQVIEFMSSSSQQQEELRPNEMLFYHNKIAAIHFKMANYLDAIKIFETILFQCPDYEPAILGLAETYVEMGRASIVRHCDKKALECTIKALGLLCRTLLYRKVEKIGSDQEKCIKFDSINYCYNWILLGDASSLLHPLNPLAVLVDSQDIFLPREEPTLATSMEEFIYKPKLTLRDFLRMAERAYIQAIILKPSCSELWRKLCHTQMLKLEHELRLVQNLEQISALPEHLLKPFAPKSIFDTGKSYEFLSKLCQARELMALPPDPYLLNMLGISAASNEVGNFEVAYGAFNACIAVDKQGPTFYSNLGVLYMIRDEVKLANGAFTNAQIIDPKYGEAWIGQATLAENTGRYEEAIDLYQHTYNLTYDRYNVVSCGASLFKLFCRSAFNNTTLETAFGDNENTNKSNLRVVKIMNYVSVQLDAFSQIMARYPLDWPLFYLNSQLSILLSGFTLDPPHTIGIENSQTLSLEQWRENLFKLDNCQPNRNSLYHAKRSLEIYMINVLSKLNFKIADFNLGRLYVQAKDALTGGMNESLSTADSMAKVLETLLEQYCFVLSCGHAPTDQLFAAVTANHFGIYRINKADPSRLAWRCVCNCSTKALTDPPDMDAYCNRAVSSHDSAKLKVLTLIASYFRGSSITVNLSSIVTPSEDNVPKVVKKSSQGHKYVPMAKYYSGDHYLSLALALLQILTNSGLKDGRERIDSLIKNHLTSLLRGGATARRSNLLYLQYAAADLQGTLDVELSKLIRNASSQSMTLPDEAIEILCHRPSLLHKYAQLFENSYTVNKGDGLFTLVHLMLGDVTKALKLAQATYHIYPFDLKNRTILSVATYGRALFSARYEAVLEITEACCIAVKENSLREIDLSPRLTTWLWQWFAFVQLSAGLWNSSTMSDILMSSTTEPENAAYATELKERLSLLEHLGKTIVYKDGSSKAATSYLQLLKTLQGSNLLSKYALGTVISSQILNSILSQDVKQGHHSKVRDLLAFLQQFYGSTSSVNGVGRTQTAGNKSNPKSAWTNNKLHQPANPFKQPAPSTQDSFTGVGPIDLYNGFLPPIFSAFWRAITAPPFPSGHGYTPDKFESMERTVAIQAFQDLITILKLHCRRREIDDSNPVLTKERAPDLSKSVGIKDPYQEDLGHGEMLAVETFHAFSTYLLLDRKDCTHEEQVRNIISTYLKANQSNIYPYEAIRQHFEHVLIYYGAIRLNNEPK